MTSSGFEIPPDQKSFQTASIFDFSSPGSFSSHLIASVRTLYVTCSWRFGVSLSHLSKGR